MISVTEMEEDGSFTISWDPDDPVESALNGWTEEDFMETIISHARRVIAEHEAEMERWDEGELTA